MGYAWLLNSQNDDEVVPARVGHINQVEVTDLLRVSDHFEVLAHALDRLSDKRSLDFSLIMITDIVDGASRILMQGASMVLEELPL